MSSYSTRSPQWSKSEQPSKLLAGSLAVLVHGVFVALLMMNVDWRNKQPEAQPMEAQLWQSLPEPPTAALQPSVSAPPAPKVKLPPPLPPVEAPDIALKAPKPQKEKPKVVEKEQKEQVIKRPVPEKVAVAKEEPKKVEPKKEVTPAPRPEKVKPALPDVNQFLTETTKSQVLSDVAKAGSQVGTTRGNVTGTANAGAGKNKALIAEYKAKIQAKIRRNVNRSACAELANPEVIFAVALLPSGELKTTPQLRKSSGSTSCDDAVEAAIQKSEPLPLPPAEADLFDEFRQLSLRFKPAEH